MSATEVAFTIRPISLNDSKELHRFSTNVHDHLVLGYPEEAAKILTLDYYKDMAAAGQDPSHLVYVAVREDLKQTPKIKRYTTANYPNLSKLNGRRTPDTLTNLRTTTIVSPTPSSLVYQGPILGYITAQRFSNGIQSVPTKSLSWMIAPMQQIGVTAFGSILRALIEEIVPSVKEMNCLCRNLVVDFAYLDSIQHHIIIRDTFIEYGFQIVGYAKRIYNRHGVMLDRLSLHLELYPHNIIGTELVKWVP